MEETQWLQTDRPWDPGKGPSVPINSHLSRFLSLADVDVQLDVPVGGGDDKEEAILTRTELDSHANMPVVGRHAYILSDTEKTATVSPYTPDYETREIPIVDAAVLYSCPYTGSDYILVIRNALFVPAMTNNLIPPFILREKGIQVCEVPKIHAKEADVNNHAIEFPETKVKEYSANMIAENILTQVDSEGYSLTMMKGIINYKRDDATAVPMSEKYVVSKRGNK